MVCGRVSAEKHYAISLLPWLAECCAAARGGGHCHLNPCHGCAADGGGLYGHHWPTGVLTLTGRLGDCVAHTDTGSTSNGDLPTLLNLSATNVVSVLKPLANVTKWKTLTLVPKTGTFTGSFELIDGLVKRPVTFSGILRQPATALDNLIGDGHYLLRPLVGTEKTTGEVMYNRP